VLIGENEMKPKRVKKNTKQFMVRINPDLIKRANEKRHSQKKEWSEIIEWLFNFYLDKT
jgi:predicted HicB family RNase H-like nuclease